MTDKSFIIKELENNFERRNIEVLWFNTFDEAKEYLLKQLPEDAKVGIGNSKTIKRMGMTEVLSSRGNIVYDKTLGKTLAEIKEIKRNSLLTDAYITSSNAVSVDGRIVNIDHSGNRVAAITYGPEKVYIVIGRNKITKTHNEALTRSRNIAAPLNAKRAGYNPPCVSLGHCVDCLGSERVCYYISTIEGQYIKDRLTLLIVNEEEGF